ncbi:MAG: hypothetical protein LBD90_06395 [Bifidobacteriaceae bacterium]|jgi:outer membrane protein assembly factor BamB|nr:hypothetical protein [Bifidobacteriaceae bacterium]
MRPTHSRRATNHRATSHPTTSRRGLALAAALALTAGLGLAACGSETEGGGTASPTAPPAETTEQSDAQEAAALTPRIAYTYDGGIQVRDATTLELVADIPLDGFNRLNSAGNGRDLMVSTAGGFQVLDLGVWQVAHGDHFHYYAAEPVLTDQKFAAAEPGHVVHHDGLTALFDDETGLVQVFESAEAEDPDRELREHTTPQPHHGVAVPLPDGTLVVSEGTADGRTGAQALGVDDGVLAASSDCPGLHGEAVAADEAVVFGCADGALVYSGGSFAKIASPAPAGASSAISATEESAVALADHSVEGAAQDQVALIDTAAGEIRLVQLPSAYYGFNDFAVVDGGSGFVLGLDGQLHFIDLASGAVTGSFPVIAAYEAPAEWQDPAPKALVLDGMIYITEPAAKKIHVVDPATGEIWKSVDLDVTPGELQGVTGDAEAEHDHDHEDEGDHEDE